MYQRKTRDVWVLFGDWGSGWDEILEEDTLSKIRKRHAEYVANDKSGRFKYCRRRVRISNT